MYEEPKTAALRALFTGVLCVGVMLTLVNLVIVTVKDFNAARYERGRVTDRARSCQAGGLFPETCRYVVVVNARGYRASFEQYATLSRGAWACVTASGPFAGSVAADERCATAGAR